MSDVKTEFNTPVQYLPGVGPKSAKKLAKLGVETVGELIYFFPRKYLDYSNISKIADIQNQKLKIPNSRVPSGKNQNYGMETSNVNKPFGRLKITDDGVTIKARIVGIGNKPTRRRRFTITEAVVEDGTGTIKVVWFNQPYLSKTLYTGREIILHGKVAWDYFNQTYVMESPDWAEKPKIVPVYRETEGVSSYYISKLVGYIKDKIENVKEFLPVEIVSANELLSLNETIRILHGPGDMAELDKARERMAFDELFLISLRGQVLKQEFKKDKSLRIDTDKTDIKELIASLPFELTSDQKKAWEDIAGDLAGKTPMNRLLNGDVGSGKTIVAALAAYAVWKRGRSIILMAPTEILAKQHYSLFKKLFSKHDIPVRLVTSSSKSQKSKPKSQNYGMGALIDTKKLQPVIYIGTHALLYREKISNLALVIIDEQHRFGVRQRQALKELMDGKEVPHFLSMTATPIPRSLQLALFAELDVSVIKEKPSNRKEIKTRVVDEVHRQKAYDFIRAHVRSGRQVFVICPLIEESQNLKAKSQKEETELFDLDRKTVAGEYEKLSKEVFPNLRIGMLHGKMKAKEKDEVMAQFSSLAIDILVSTSVVEVGVDIPNATIMMIEDAERFGLAQLHQFRGRVGRGEHQSFCFLFSHSQSEKSLKRLKILEQTNDGFKLAEFDLKNRGAGDIFGTEQSGFMDIKFANLSDALLIAKASESAKKVAQNDPNLSKHKDLQDRLGDFLSSKHLE